MLYGMAALAALFLIISAPVTAQDLLPAAIAVPPVPGHADLIRSYPALHPKLPGCRNAEMQPAQEITVRQRACLYANQMIAPGAIAHALLSSSLSEWRNTPHVAHQDPDDLAGRFGIFYARKGARNLGEFIVGSIHHENLRHEDLRHEDLRPRLSFETGFWNRTRSALLSVVVSEDANGVSRPVLAPIAGAFGCGFVGAAGLPEHGLLQDGLRRTGAAYGGYFGSAVFREFKPDLTLLAAKILHRK